MKQCQWNVELLRKVNGQYITLEQRKVWEFDGECLDYNLWVGALKEFEKIIQVGDLIKTCGNEVCYIRYNDDGTGTVV